MPIVKSSHVEYPRKAGGLTDGNKVTLRAIALAVSWVFVWAIFGSDGPTLFYQGLGIGIRWSLDQVEHLRKVACDVGLILLFASLSLAKADRMLAWAIGDVGYTLVKAFLWGAGKDLEGLPMTLWKYLSAVGDSLPSTFVELLLVGIGIGLCLAVTGVSRRRQRLKKAALRATSP